MREYLHEPVAKHGFWRIGGNMDRFCLIESTEDLAGVGQIDHVIGNGSNLLVPDAGLRGTTIKLSGEFRSLAVLNDEHGLVQVGAGLLNAVLLKRLDQMEWGGLGCLAGVPGTLGGAIAMNAGTALGELSQALIAVEGFVRDGGGPDGGGCNAGGRDAGGRDPGRRDAGVCDRLHTLQRADLPMTYREGGLPSGFIVTSAVLQLSRQGIADERARITEHLARRKATQPLELPSCGSVFRNPPGRHAGQLIEQVGLKGWRSGGMQISPKHANFIVNVEAGTATDAMRCIRKAWDTVLAETGVRLVPEVHVLGDWSSELWPLP